MPSLTTLAQWLAGEFDNQAQAQDQPVWFVNLRLWHRPLPFRVDDHLALFCEQANSLYLDAPYRQRVLVLKPGESTEQSWRVEYKAFKQPERYKGAGANPELLNHLTIDQLESLPGCELNLTYTAERFKAESEPEAKCCFQYNGQTRQVILGFEATPNQFFSFDRGVDPETGKLLWGALMGAYEFQKRQAFEVQS
jgi:hypothetical protein